VRGCIIVKIFAGNAKVFDQRGNVIMKKLALALLALPLVQSGALAQNAGNVDAGKTYWDRAAPRPTLCKNCHGASGEGAFGPDLAGRGLNAAQVMHAVRKPWGIMPAFTESQFSDQDAADVAAYFASLPKVAEPGKWRTEVPDGAPAGQATMINMGCGQCHGPTFGVPRATMGGIDMDFDQLTSLVYTHTTAMPKLRETLGIQGTNLSMGNFMKTRVTPGELKSIYSWARDEAGFRVPLTGRLSKGEAGADGVSYILTVANGGLPNKGLVAEDITVSLSIPADTKVVAATGAGYQGVQTDEKTKASTAVWKLPRSAPKDQERMTVTLSKAATAAANLKGEVRWAKPAMKAGPDSNPIAPAPL
jgi:mono/diheme cytochrome c family protein